MRNKEFRDFFGEPCQNSFVAVMDIMGFSAMMKANSGMMNQETKDRYLDFVFA